MLTVTYKAVDRVLQFRDGESIRFRLACFQKAEEAEKMREEMNEEWRSKVKKEAAASIGAKIWHEVVPVREVLFESLDEFKTAMRG